jgi:hypothetical protein
MDTKQEEKAWRDALADNGLENVKLKLARIGGDRDARIIGFKDQRLHIPRGFVEDWVAEEDRKAATERRRTLVWAIVAGVTGIVAVASPGLLALAKTVVGLFKH